MKDEDRECELMVYKNALNGVEPWLPKEILVADSNIFWRKFTNQINILK